jgi:hypothetical protein
MKIVTIILVYIISVLIWIFDILIPFGRNILLHIQNSINGFTPLNLLYCGEQLLKGIIYTLLLYTLVMVINILLFKNIIKK